MCAIHGTNEVHGSGGYEGSKYSVSRGYSTGYDSNTIQGFDKMYDTNR